MTWTSQSTTRSWVRRTKVRGIQLNQVKTERLRTPLSGHLSVPSGLVSRGPRIRSMLLVRLDGCMASGSSLCNNRGMVWWWSNQFAIRKGSVTAYVEGGGATRLYLRRIPTL